MASSSLVIKGGNGSAHRSVSMSPRKNCAVLNAPKAPAVKPMCERSATATIALQ
ncbi:hypothetical protein [Mycolicibacterium stellerae]|uniref:hypothetical protein n=1 Tax=Mycolicibacterium stellerae TaxID=2358193 RepID=UPI0019D23DB4|nr:hypothetical protein [Mycolicibacterium stellerae]